MSSTSATQLITIVSCDENDIDFMSQSKIELGSQETSKSWHRCNLGDLYSKVGGQQKSMVS